MDTRLLPGDAGEAARPVGGAQDFPLDLASRACNLAERMRLAAALDGGPAGSARRGPQPGAALDAFDAWKIDTLAGKLAEQFRKESVHRGTPLAYTRDELTAVLTSHRLRELDPRGQDPHAAALLTGIHDAWLPTYRTVLDGFDRSRHLARSARWRHPDVYYGRFAKVCEPFLLHLEQELITEFDEQHATAARVLLDPRLIEDLQLHLLDRFELSLAWATETDANVYCARRGIDKAAASTEDYLAYLDGTFRDAATYHRFYCTFPVLGRWLAHVTRMLADHGRAIAGRLVADAPELGAAFFGRPIERFTSIRPGRSDYHAGARSVALVEADLAGGGHGSFIYKPRCVRSEAGMQQLLGRLRDDGVLGFATRDVLPRDGYGYEALIPAGRNRVDGAEQAAAVYAELGGYLAVFHVLGGGDLHFENVLVADCHAYICDCETVLGVLPRGQDRPEDTVLDSVFSTGLLEWPRTPTAAAGAMTEMRISGYAGGETYELPIAVPQVNGRRQSFQVSVAHQTGIRVEPDGANRVFVGDRLVQPDEHAEAIRNGFDRVHQWFERQPDEAERCVREAFAGASARFISWGTQVYTQLLIAARHPKCLMEPLEVDLLVNTLRTYPRKWDPDGVLAQRELESMWRLDVPIFTADAAGRELVHDHRTGRRDGDRTAPPARLDRSPLDQAAARIRRLSARNRARQGQYIAASLSTGQVSSPAFSASAVEYASRIGEKLAGLLRPAGAPAPWTSYQLEPGGGISEVDVQADLYNGSAGIALFLAYLDAVAPRPEFRAAAERALAHTVAACDRRQIGAFQGLGGLVYLLTHLHHLWRDPELLGKAVRLSRELAGRVDEDRHFDVLSGAAGVIPVMLGLADRTGGETVEHAHRCARHLLRHAVAEDATLSWPYRQPDEAIGNLTGFSHGAAGVGWALVALGRAADRPDYVEAGRRAFAYETRHFDQAEQDWYDLRTNVVAASRDGRHFANAWCNGAAGIGLSRIASWAVLDRTDDALLREAHQALAATLRNFHKLGNDTLCHGRSGNAELFLRFARLKDEPAFQLEANVQVRTQWRELDESHGAVGDGTGSFFPGLMIGLSGFGLHFLRLAHPDLVPSPLLLDPPGDHPYPNPATTRP